MNCSACGNPVGPTDWICSFCDHILDPSVLEEATNPEDDEAREERTQMIAWSGPEQDDAIPEAVMLGDVSIAENEFGGVVHGPGRDDSGHTATFLYYTSGSTTRVIHPDAVPRIAETDATIPRTPYEDFILSCIDGKRSVRAIQKASGLAPQEVVVTLLTLLDKGAVEIETRRRSSVAEEADDRKDTPTVEPRRRTRRPRSMPPARGSSDATEALKFKEKPKIAGPIPDDFDDLPSVSDFEEIVDELERQGDPGPFEDEHFEPEDDHDSTGSLDDVWAESSHPEPVVPQPLEEDPPASEEVTKAIQLPARPATPIKASASRRQPRRPPPLPDDSEARPKKETAEQLAAALDPTPPPKVSKPVPLDPSFLVEVPASVAEPAPLLTDDEDPDAPVVAPLSPKAASTGVREEDREKKRRALAAALKRGPIQEVDRRKASRAKDKSEKKKDKPAKKKEIEAPVLEPVNASEESADSLGPAPVDSARMVKAQKLFDQALTDKAAGNLVSARMNMKLALTFDPTNNLYQQAFDDLSKNPDAVPGGTPQGRSRARELYDQATEAENHGNVDKAIELLEKALSESRQAPFYNRLGVILATKRGEYQRAQELIEKALELAPGNSLYEKNLSKVLSKAAAADVSNRGGEKKGGLLGFLGRRK